MREIRAGLLLLFIAAGARAQDSSFSQLRLRGAALRLPVVEHISDDWRTGTGFQLDVASDVAISEIALSVGRMGFNATTGRPSFSQTFISLGWTGPVVRHARFGLAAGARLTDVRMDFDDPSLVGGLRTEEEQLLSAIARGRFPIVSRYSGFIEASYGVLMTSTHTPMASFAVGLQRDGRMPGWLRNFLR